MKNKTVYSKTLLVEGFVTGTIKEGRSPLYKGKTQLVVKDKTLYSGEDDSYILAKFSTSGKKILVNDMFKDYSTSQQYHRVMREVKLRNIEIIKVFGITKTDEEYYELNAKGLAKVIKRYLFSRKNKQDWKEDFHSMYSSLKEYIIETKSKNVAEDILPFLKDSKLDAMVESKDEEIFNLGVRILKQKLS